MANKGIQLLSDKLVLMSEDICPRMIYEAVAKKHPDGIKEQWFAKSPYNTQETSDYLEQLGVRFSADKKKPKPRSSLDQAFERVTRSKTMRTTAGGVKKSETVATKGYSPILPASRSRNYSLHGMSDLSLDVVNKPARRDSFLPSNTQRAENHKRSSSDASQVSNTSSQRLLLFISSDPDHSRDAVRAKSRSRSAPAAAPGGSGQEKRSPCSDESNGSGLKIRLCLNSRSCSSSSTEGNKMKALNPDAACHRMRPARRSASAKTINPTFTTNTVLHQKRSRPPAEQDRENKRVKGEIVDLTISDDDKKEQEPKGATNVQPDEKAVKQEDAPLHQGSSSGSSLTDLDEHQMAHLERTQSEVVFLNSSSDLSSPHKINSSSSSLVGSSPPLPQMSSAAATSSAAFLSFPRFIVLDAATWTLRAYNTAAKARARCQEHPVPVNHSKNKTRQRRNLSLTVGPPIDIGHGMQLFVHDAVHNSTMNSMMNKGVNLAAEKWGRQLAREVVLEPEYKKTAQWIKAKGFDHDLEDAMGDVAAGITGAPLRWYQVRAKVDELRRNEGFEKKEDEHVKMEGVAE